MPSHFDYTLLKLLCIGRLHKKLVYSVIYILIKNEMIKYKFKTIVKNLENKIFTKDF